MEPSGTPLAILRIEEDSLSKMTDWVRFDRYSENHSLTWGENPMAESLSKRIAWYFFHKFEKSRVHILI